MILPDPPQVVAAGLLLSPQWIPGGNVRESAHKGNGVSVNLQHDDLSIADSTHHERGQGLAQYVGSSNKSDSASLLNKYNPKSVALPKVAML